MIVNSVLLVSLINAECVEEIIHACTELPRKAEGATNGWTQDLVNVPFPVELVI